MWHACHAVGKLYQALQMCRNSIVASIFHSNIVATADQVTSDALVKCLDGKRQRINTYAKSK